ncbi:MAG: hypothetical protein KatS3mg051_1679 [Anaerolineae bacterium]|nr:MAG: hypothetical protein KatS3mg051_1679 [Anaerolineae bacterium]
MAEYVIQRGTAHLDAAVVLPGTRAGRACACCPLADPPPKATSSAAATFRRWRAGCALTSARCSSGRSAGGPNERGPCPLCASSVRLAERSGSSGAGGDRRRGTRRLRAKASACGLLLEQPERLYAANRLLRDTARRARSMAGRGAGPAETRGLHPSGLPGHLPRAGCRRFTSTRSGAGRLLSTRICPRNCGRWSRSCASRRRKNWNRLCPGRCAPNSARSGANRRASMPCPLPIPGCGCRRCWPLRQRFLEREWNELYFSAAGCSTAQRRSDRRGLSRGAAGQHPRPPDSSAKALSRVKTQSPSW